MTYQSGLNIPIQTFKEATDFWAQLLRVTREGKRRHTEREMEREKEGKRPEEREERWRRKRTCYYLLHVPARHPQRVRVFQYWGPAPQTLRILEQWKPRRLKSENQRTLES